MLSTDLSSPTGAFSFPKWSLLFWHHVVCEPNNFIAHMHMHTYRYGACKEMFNRRSWSWACERNVSHLSCSGQQAERMAKFETQRCGKVAIQLDRVSVNNINRCLLHSEKALEEKELNVSINRYSFCSCVSYSYLFFVNIIVLIIQKEALQVADILQILQIGQLTNFLQFTLYLLPWLFFYC